MCKQNAKSSKSPALGQSNGDRDGSPSWTTVAIFSRFIGQLEARTAATTTQESVAFCLPGLPPYFIGLSFWLQTSFTIGFLKFCLYLSLDLYDQALRGMRQLRTWVPWELPRKQDDVDASYPYKPRLGTK